MLYYINKNTGIIHKDICACLEYPLSEDYDLYSIDYRSSGLRRIRCLECSGIEHEINTHLNEINTIMEGVPYTTSYFIEDTKQYCDIETNHRKFRLHVGDSTGMMRLFVYCKLLNKDYGYEKVRSFPKTWDVTAVFKYIVREERYHFVPVAFRKSVENDIKFCKDNNLGYWYGAECMYIKTDIALWAICWDSDRDKFFLLHSPDYSNSHYIAVEHAAGANYHRQVDAFRRNSVYKYLMYIVEHDIAKKIISDDYKNLPRRTPKQRKYYKSAEKKHKQKEIRNVYKLIDKLSSQRG